MCDISANRKPFVVVIFLNFCTTLLAVAQVNLPPAFIPNPSSTIRPFRDDRRFDHVGFSSSTPYPFSSTSPVTPFRDFPYNPNDPRNDYDQNFGQRPSDLPPNFVPKNNDVNPQDFNRPLNPNNGGGRGFDDDFGRRNRVEGDIRGLLQALDIQASQMCTSNVAAQWNFETNINQATQLDAVSILLLINN